MTDNLTQEAVNKIRGIQSDVRNQKREKDFHTLYDLMEPISGLLIQIHADGCSKRCDYRIGWPAAVTIITISLSIMGLLILGS